MVASAAAAAELSAQKARNIDPAGWANIPYSIGCAFPEGFSEVGYTYTKDFTDDISFTASSGRAFIGCGTGEQVKAVDLPAFYGLCNALPISKTRTFNAIGFSVPLMYVKIFGIAIDLGNSGYQGGKSVMTKPKRTKKQEDALERTGPKKTSSRAQQQAEAMAGGWSGACMAYSASGVSFGLALSSMLKIQFNPFTGMSCLANPPGSPCLGVTGAGTAPLGSPLVGIELLGFSISDKRDLEMVTASTFYNPTKNYGLDTIGTDGYTIAGDGGSGAMVYMRIVLDLQAFKFGAVTASLYMTGQILLDVSGGVDDIGRGFKSILKGDFDAIDFGFQLTFDGTLSITIFLFTHISLTIELGNAALTMGVNMQDKGYRDFSNGLYAAAATDICLLDIFPPLKANCKKRNLWALLKRS